MITTLLKAMIMTDDNNIKGSAITITTIVKAMIMTMTKIKLMDGR